MIGTRWIADIALNLLLTTWFSTTLAQSRELQLDPYQPIPAEAWQNMDAHRAIDPRIHKLQMDNQIADQKAARRQAQLEQAYRAYNDSETLRARQLGLPVGTPAVRTAISASVQYLAQMEVDGPVAANRWLNSFRTAIDRQIQTMETPNAQMGSEALIGLSSLLTPQGYISKYPRQLGELKDIRSALARLGR